MAFAEGKLPEPASDAIFRHVTLCVDCEDTLARLSDQTPRRCGGQPISTEEALLSEPECLRMQEAVRKFPLQLGRDQPQDASQQSTDSTRLSTGSPPPARARKAVGETTELLPATPHTIGRYEVRSILGEGSYGRVYLAHDPQLDRQVAVKVAKFGSDVRQEVIDAFLREAKVAAKLKHPGIVAVYDAGVDAKAGCFIVMEYVAGKSLKHLLKASKVSHESAARYVAQAAEALAYAHKLDLVHRDLKPANLLIDADDNVRVADFGLAIFEEEQRKHAGEFAGTLAYCSPEQIRGEVPHLDGRSDIWSLGVILYELLTGRRPFGGSSVAEEILHRPAKPPRQIDDSIPADLEQVCLKCLAKEASQRYPAAKDLAREVCHDVVPPRPVPWLWIAGLSSAAALVALVLLTPPLLGVWNSPGGSSEDSTGVQLAPETQEIPYLVDEAARPFVAWPLLTRPLKAPFEPAQRTERWELVDERDELWITTPTLFLVGLGETNLKDYRYHVDVTSNTPTADAGVFFGYHPAPPMEGKPAWRCHLLTVHNSPGRTVTTIKRHRALVVAAGDTFMLQPTTIAASDVPYATMRGASLEVTIGEGRLSEVRWLDRPLLDLTTDDLDHPDFPTTGEFGVIAYRGTMIFTDAQFTNHGR